MEKHDASIWFMRVVVRHEHQVLSCSYHRPIVVPMKMSRRDLFAGAAHHNEISPD
jgi:hypothetical protein